MKFDIYDLTFSAYNVIKKSKVGKVRYPAVYKKVTEYVKTHYENANLSDLMKTESGWSCVASSKEKSVVIYITENTPGKYSIWEKQI